MTYRILVALDGSPASEAALSEVERIALAGSSVHFLHVVPILTLNANATSAGVMAGHDQAVHYLGGLRERLPDLRGLDLIRTGDPADAILQVALEFDIDLIAMGPSGPAGVGMWPPGGAIESVMRGAQRPVLLGRRGILPAHQILRRILVPLDGSEDSMAIIPTVKDVAIRAAAEVVFLHVSDPTLAPLPPPRSPTEFGASEDPEKKLLSLAERLENSDLEFWQTIATGDAAQEIVSQAEILDVDLIAMSTQGHRERETTIVGRAATAVLERSPRSVLLQRPVADSIEPNSWKFQ